jgi:hypothetical protein
MRAFWLSGAVAVGLSLAACADNEMKMHEQSLFTRLGGKPAITAVVDEFIATSPPDKTHQRLLRQCRHPRPEGQARRP